LGGDSLFRPRGGFFHGKLASTDFTELFPLFVLDTALGTNSHLDLRHMGLLDFTEGVARGEGEGRGGGGGLYPSEVAALLIHPSIPPSSRECSHPPFSSRISKETPRLTCPMTR
jgi:hypothetical protein